MASSTRAGMPRPRTPPRPERPDRSRDLLRQHEPAHADAWPLETFAEGPDLGVRSRRAEAVEQRQEVIVGGVRPLRDGAEHLEVDRLRVIALHDSRRHARIEL